MAQVMKAAVVGIDIGAVDTVVAYVGKGAVDVVQNEVSSRKTPSLVGFQDNKRLLGDAALSAIKSNMKNTCRAFHSVIGRSMDDPIVKVEEEWSCADIVEVDGKAGFRVNFKGEEVEISAEKVLAAYLTKLRGITEGWCQAKLSDIVLAIPAALTDVQRQAFLDACQISGLKCLRLMHEHAAVALSYGIYRSNDFDAEKPLNVMFVNSGHAHTSAFVASFVRGKLTVLSEASTAYVSGRAMDLTLMKHFGAQFQKKFGCDPLSNKKARFKLEEAVRKTKSILSSNAEATISIECLMEDEDLGGKIDRPEFEAMCADMVPMLTKVLEDALSLSGLAKEELHFVEVSGGSCRVPWIKNTISAVTGVENLSCTLNMDECVARGCALQAAMLSPLFKVRDFKVVDKPKFPVSINWTDAGCSGADGEDVQMEDMEESQGKGKSALLFPATTEIPQLKNVSFKRKSAFEVSLEYKEPANLPAGAKPALGKFEIALAPTETARKVRVLTELDLHGMARVQKAELLEEEEYEETIKEKREVTEAPASPEAEAPAEAGETAEAPAEEKPAEEGAEAEKKEEKKEEKKKKEPKAESFEWVEVKKTKRRTKVTDLPITRTGVAGMTSAKLSEAADAETQMQAAMRDIEETENAQNDLESYVYNMRDKTSEGGQYGEFILPADREVLHAELQKAEDWLYDHFDATKVQFVEKLAELQKLGEPAAQRFKSMEARADYFPEVEKTIAHYRALAESTEEKYAHIAAEKKQQILDECKGVEGWLAAKKAEQDGLAKHLDPVLTVAMMQQKQQDISQMADKIMAEPKPAPPVEAPAEKKEDTPADTAEPEVPDPKPEEVEASLDVD